MTEPTENASTSAPTTEEIAEVKATEQAPAEDTSMNEAMAAQEAADQAVNEEVPFDPLAIANDASADEDDEDAMALMESAMESFSRPTDYKVGDKVQGRVVSIDSQYIFLDLGSKSEASIPKEALAEDEGDLPVVGDMLEAYVVGLTAGNVELGRSLPGGDDALATLEEAFHNQVPVEGTITGRNKGGFEVKVFNKRAFCPISQIELRYCDNPDVHLNQTYTFRITELKEGGRNIVISRRAILEEENREKAEAIREQIAPGVEMVGKVTSLMNYGAFVDLGAGIEGLVHVSAISHHRVQDPADVLSVGQQVRVLIEKVNPDNDRISLSMKALEEDPWDQAVSAFQEGTVASGKVVRLQPFGAFVELAPGVDGLIHISELSHRRVNHPKEVVEAGQQVDVKVIKLDLEKKRIGLSMKELDMTGMPAAIEGEVREGITLEAIVDKVETFGVFVRLPQGKRGLIPNKELDAPRSADIVKKYPPESRVQAFVQQIDDSGRIRLSEKAVHKQKERAEFNEYKQSSKKKEGQVFGTLGDLLKNMQK